MNKKVGIAALGSYVPPKVLTNADLEKMVETNNEWIVTRTGIEERHIATDEIHASGMAVEAGRDCLSQTSLKPDLLISSSGTNEMKYPYQASIVANNLNLSGLAAFDMNAGCSGLVYSLAIASSMIQTGPFKNALITASEKMSEFVDYTDRASCILFGDAAAAVLLSAEQPEHELLTFELGTDPTGSSLVTMGGKGKDFYFHQEGKNVFKFAVNKIEEMVITLKERVAVKDERRLFVIPHQANMRIIQAAIDKLKLPAEQFICNIHKYGNTSSATVGLALHEAEQAGRFQKGDIVLLIGFGAGLSWAGAAVEW